MSRPRKYTFDPDKMRYRDSDGKLVAASAVRELVNSVLDEGRGVLQDLADAYLQGDMTRAEWEEASKEAIKAYHIAAAGVARGGADNLTKSDWSALGALLQRQYRFFGEFSRQVQSALAGDEPEGVSRDAVLNRAGMYADAARNAGANMERRTALQAGKTEEKRMLTAEGSHKSTCEDCREMNAQGWQPIGTLPSIGDSQCITNCRCYFAFR